MKELHIRLEQVVLFFNFVHGKGRAGSLVMDALKNTMFIYCKPFVKTHSTLKVRFQDLIKNLNSRMEEKRRKYLKSELQKNGV